MKSSNSLIEMPSRMNELWTWVAALDAWYYCAPSRLAALVASEPIPPEFLQVIAQIIAGERSPNRKAAAKLKIPAEERMDIAHALSHVIGLIDLLSTNEYQPGLEVNAGDKGVEPIEIIRQLDAERTAAIQSAVKEFGVSTETVENLLRDLRKKIAAWPSL